MKKKLLSVSIPFLLNFTAPVAAYDLYTSDDTKASAYAQLRWHVSKDTENSKKDMVTVTEPRIGFRLNSQLTEETNLFAHSQISLGKTGSSRHDNNFENRLSFVSLNNNTFGKITVGKQWILSDSVLFPTNKSYEHWAEALRYSALGGAGRNSSLIKYEYKVGDLWLAANHGFAGKNNDEISEIAAGYTMDKLKLNFVAGEASNEVDGVIPESPKKNSFYGGVLGYSNDSVKFDLLYTEGEVKSGSAAVDDSSYIVSTSYNLMENSKVFVGYEVLKQKSSGYKKELKGGYLGMDYRFNDVFLIFAEYSSKSGDKLDVNNGVVSSSSRDSGNINLGLRVSL